MKATTSNAALTDDLMAIKAHLQVQPSPVPGNLIAGVSWHMIGELYYVSQPVS